MANTLVVAGDIDGYGATHDEDNRVLPVAMLDRNPHHPTSRGKHSSSSRPSSWKTNIMGLTAVVVVAARATVFVSILRDAPTADPPAARTGPEADLLQHYPYVTITNKTPFDVRPPMKDDSLKFRLLNFSVGYLGVDAMCFLGFCCPYDFMNEGLSYGQTITASSRGLCLVDQIYATLWYYTEERDYNTKVICAPYHSSGTSHSIYSILLKGNDVNRNACCIRSSHELQACD